MTNKISASVMARLWLMMLFQYGIWGAWAVVGGTFMTNPKPEGLNLTGTQLGIIFSILPLASIFAPSLFGQLADRFVNAERIMGVLHLLGAVTLYYLSQQTEYVSFLWLMLAYSVFYAPTLALSNAITFAHLSDRERDFGLIRVAGTIGWIAAGLLLAAWRHRAPTPVYGDLFILAAVLSVTLGVISFSLPKTPPTQQPGHPFAMFDAFQLLKNRDFLIFAIVAFVVGTELEFYYIHTSPFLGAPIGANGIGISEKSLPAIMSIAQIAEIVVMLALPFFLKRLGVRKTLVIGIITWPIRYAIFAFAPIPSLVIPSLALHGFCYVFFFVVGFIYVDQIAPPAIRASAQALIALIVLGLGRYAGSLFAGRVQDYFTEYLDAPRMIEGVKVQQIVQWDKVFMVPCLLTVICAIVFPLVFKGTTQSEPTQSA